MNVSRKWWAGIIGGVVVAAVLGTGAVMAQTPVPGTTGTGTTFLDRVAAKLGIDTSTLRTAVQGASNDQVDARVASGELTQAQADALKARIASAPDGAFGDGIDFGGPRGGKGGFADAAVASFLGVTQAELRTQLSATGATLATVAQANAKGRDELKAFLTSQAQSRVDAEVAAGRMTQAEADAEMAEEAASLDARIDSTGVGHGGPGFGHGFDGPEGAPAPGTPNSSTTPGTNNG